MPQVRHVRWAGDRTLADRLVLVLHVAYAFVPLGFLLLGAAVLWPAIVPTSAGLHAWMAGAIGMMTLAVMTRASLGHTSQELVASLPTQLIYLCAFIRHACPHRRGIRAIARAPSHRRLGLDPRLRRLCRVLWALADREPPGLEYANLRLTGFRRINRRSHGLSFSPPKCWPAPHNSLI